MCLEDIREASVVNIKLAAGQAVVICYYFDVNSLGEFAHYAQLLVCYYILKLNVVEKKLGKLI